MPRRRYISRSIPFGKIKFELDGSNCPRAFYLSEIIGILFNDNRNNAKWTQLSSPYLVEKRSTKGRESWPIVLRPAKEVPLNLLRLFVGERNWTFLSKPRNSKEIGSARRRKEECLLRFFRDHSFHYSYRTPRVSPFITACLTFLSYASSRNLRPPTRWNSNWNDPTGCRKLIKLDRLWKYHEISNFN